MAFRSPLSRYDVFLSFRGEDTRQSFVSHLYDALAQKGITTFKDDVIEKPNASWKEIEESRFAIVIFSKSYASSSWCLDELVKIMECYKKKGQLVLPVFYYDFNPSNLRRPGPAFGELFAKYDMAKVRAWMSVLVEASNLNGIGLIDHRYQATRINEIVETVLGKLNINNLNYNKNTMGKRRETLGDTTSSREQFIGIDRRVQQIKELLKVKTVKTSSDPALASSSTRSSRWTYDVFISFKANDTCQDFVNHLYFALKRHNIYAFRNDQAFARAESIDSEHLKIIEESQIAVVVISKKYASSCCLDELVKIMNCDDGMGRIVFPIFYDVDTSDVLCQKGPFGEAFMRNETEKIEISRKALVKACSLAGWYLNCTSKGDEDTVIKSIVDAISRRLNWLPSSVDENLIGVEAHMKNLRLLLKLQSGSVHKLGICGMGGIGKTTIARAVFNQVSSCFDGSCFVKNIREVSKSHDLNHIQREMLSKLLNDEKLHVRSNYEEVDPRLKQRKVLLVLDDVDDISQLKALDGFGKQFGGGSRIIVTTRDEQLLVAHNIMQTYYVKPLADDESYQFLRRHAFKKDDSTEAYKDLFPQVVSYAAGLPLALEVLSKLLCGKSKKEWADTLARLQVFPEKAILDTLRKSYDSLSAAEKEVFLDIACFFHHTKRDYAVNVLNSCGFSGERWLQSLEQKCLLSILKDEIKMHKLIVQMGRHIVRQMYPYEPVKRSRLWLAEDVCDILKGKTGAQEIEAIVVDDMPDYDALDVTKAFKSMKKLRLLQIRSRNKLRFLERSNYIPKNLHWLTLEKYPLPSLPASFRGDKLVGLELLGSSISELWRGTKVMCRLCYLDLSYSRKLIKTPDFTGTPNLEELKLEYCTRLIEVHESIGYLDRLRLLSLKNCTILEALPQSIMKLKSLTYLDVSGCLNLKFSRLQLQSDTRTIKAPGSIGFLRNLVDVDLSCLGNLSSPSHLKAGGSYRLHDTLVDIIVQRSTSPERKTSQEMI